MINCVDKEDEYKPTYSHSTLNNFYVADYCFAKKEMTDKCTVKKTIIGIDEKIAGKNKNIELSDHCPD